MKNNLKNSASQPNVIPANSWNILRLAAVGVLAGLTASAPAFAADLAGGDRAAGGADTTYNRESDSTPSEDGIAAADPSPAVVFPTTKAVEPTTPGPVTPDVKATQPSTPDVKTPDATTPDVKTPVVSTPDVKSPEPATPDVKTPPVAPATTVAAPATQPAHEGPALVASGLDADGSIRMMVNESRIITTKAPFTQAHVPAEDVAFPIIKQTGPSAGKEILLEAKKPGSTQLVIWDDQNHSQVIHVIVGYDLFGLDQQLKQMFPRAAMKVEVAKGTIVLSGHVPDLVTAQKAVQIATPYGAGGASPVLNFLEVSGGQQVILQVRFAEVTRQVESKLGFNAFVSDGKFALGVGTGPAGAGFPLGGSGSNIGNATLLANTNGSAFPIYGGAMAGNASFEYFVNALRTNGLLRILAEPNLTAISGQQASFLAGGEIPILVPQASGGGSVTTVDYKQYGIQLNFTPTVLGDGRVRLQVTPQVSELDYAHAVTLGGEPVPALTTRNVNTTVELAEGQTFSLAGLLKNEVTATRTTTPVLGDLPILGELFRSVDYQRQETELVVLVTPHLVEALNPGQVPPVPGETWRDPNEAQLFLHGDLGGPAPDKRHAPALKSSHFYGTTGYTPAAAPQK